MITDPRSSLTETKSNRKESTFSAKMPVIKSVGAANRQSPATPRKFVALYHRTTKIRMRSDERDQLTPTIDGHRRTGRGGEGGCSPPKFWTTQIFWAARENLGKASF